MCFVFFRPPPKKKRLFNTSDDLLDNLRQYDYRKRGVYYITHPPEKWCCGKRVMAGLEADEWCKRPHALTDQVRAILEELELASSAEPSPGNHPTYRSTTSTTALPGLEPGAENASRCILRSPIDPVVSLNHVIAAWSYVAPGQSLTPPVFLNMLERKTRVDRRPATPPVSFP